MAHAKKDSAQRTAGRKEAERVGRTNQEIRKLAWTIYRANLGQLTAIALVVGGVQFLFTLISRLVGFPGLWHQVASFVWSTLAFPVVTLGAAHAGLSAWRGERPRVGMLGWAFRAPGRLWGALAVGAAVEGISIAGSAFLSLLRVISWPQAMALTVIVIVGTAITWVSQRLFLVSYLCVSEENVPKPVEALHTSFGSMRGNVWSSIAMSIMAFFRAVFSAFGVLMIVLSIGLTLGAESIMMNASDSVRTLLQNGVSMALFAPLAAYVYVAMAGFADKLLPREPGVSGGGGDSAKHE